MFQSVRVAEVLSPFRNLKHLSAFAFPQNTDFRSCVCSSLTYQLHHTSLTTSEKILWPPNLREITLSGRSSQEGLFHWEHFIRDWPNSLQQVIIDNWRIKRLRSSVHEHAKISPNLRSLHITDLYSNQYSMRFIADFSGLPFLSLPANIAMPGSLHVLPKEPPALEQLELRRMSDYGLQHVDFPNLLRYVECMKSLQQVRLHISLVEGHDEDVEKMDAVLKSHASVRNKAGVTRIESSDARIVVFDT